MRHLFPFGKNYTFVLGDVSNRLESFTHNVYYPMSKEESIMSFNDKIELTGEHTNKEIQLSDELIHIKDSCDVVVDTTDTKAAVNLQASLQAVIAIVISISIGDSTKAEKITQDLVQSSKMKQETIQKLVIENSQNVNVTTTDTQIAANIQVLLQILLALLVKLDIL